MGVRATGGKWLILCSLLALAAPIGAEEANAAGSRASQEQLIAWKRTEAHNAETTATWLRRSHVRRPASRGVSCVPFARWDSGILVRGNAYEWWPRAAGVYARGSVPEIGSVLAFRANTHMPLGHVAVVSRIVNQREIRVDQANWAPGRVARNVAVVDVSPENDWTSVRVQLARSSDFGNIYPTFGFIYDRPDDGRMIVASGRPAPIPELTPARADLRPIDDPYEQVAEAPGERVSRRSSSRAQSRHLDRPGLHRAMDRGD
jgi:hypothetical protein